MKKIVILVTIVSMVVLGSLSAAATEITFWAMDNAPSQAHITWMEEKAEEFEAQTGIKVIFEEVGWDMQNQNNAIATGSGAEVFQVGTTQTAMYAASGQLAELDIRDFGGASKFMDANLESCIHDGKYYAVPWFAETRALFYNTEMFEQAGAEVPQTWEELKVEGQKIVDEFGEGSAIAIAGTAAWDIQHNLGMLIWSHGGNFLNEDNTRAVFDDEAGYSAMRYWVSLVDEGLADKACAEYNQPQADAAFINGDVAMALMGPFNVAGIEADNPGLPYEVAEPPAGPAGRASFSGGSNLVIRTNNVSALEIEAAKAWVKFLIQQDNMVEYTKGLTNMLPATVDGFDDPYYQSGKWKLFKEVLDYATAYTSIPQWGEVETSFVNSISNTLTDYIDGNYTEDSAEEYVDAAVAEINYILR